MSLKLACPRCHHVQFFDDAFAGQAVTCGKCAQVFRVPRAAEPALAEAPAPAATAQVDAPAPVAIAPWPASTQARELPTTFAQSEPLAVKVVELPDTSAERDREDLGRPEPARDEPWRREQRGPVRVRPRLDEPTKLPWTFGVSLVAFLLLLFGATAAWFMIRDHRPPPQKAMFNQPQMPQQRFQPPVQPVQPNLPQPMQGFQQPGQGRRDDIKGQVAPVAPQPNEKLIPIKLDNGQVKVAGSLTFNDPFDPLSPGCRRKVYEIELEPFREYTIEMMVDPPQPPQRPGVRVQPIQLDPYLRLEDAKGTILDFNDDIKETVILDSRMVVGIREKGKYRIIATSFGVNETGNFLLNVRDETRGKPVNAKQLPPRPLPKPAAVDLAQKPAGEKRGDVLITTILQSDTPLVGDLCWAPDGKAFFALDTQGTLRRIDWPENLEIARLTTGSPASSLCLSRAGLLISYPSLHEVWVIDPATLEVQKRVSVPGVERVSAAPASDIACAAVRLEAAPPKKGRQIDDDAEKAAASEGIIILDAKSGKSVRQYAHAPKHLTMTPDGKYVFAEGRIERLVRYRVVGEKNDMLFADDESPRLAGNGQGIFTSPDSNYVCLTSPGGNYATDPAMPVKQYTTLIFKTTELKKPAFAIWTGESPRAVGFDPAAGAVVSHNNEKQIMLFSEAGVRTQEENLPGDRLAVAPRQFLPHPTGGRMLVRTENAVFGVEFAKEGK